MAEQTGPFGFRGKLGNVVGYLLNGKPTVRMIGSTENTQEHPETKRVQNTFGGHSTQNKYFRNVLVPFLRELQRKKLDNDVMTLFSKVHNCDPRTKEERTLSGGLLTPEGLALFNGFEFNKAPGWVRYLLHASVLTDTAAQTILLKDFVPSTCINAPQGANRAVLSSCVARLDFTTETGEIAVSSSQTVDLHDVVVRDIVLTPESRLTGAGLYLLLLKIVFFEHLNGVDYPLAGAGNGCMVVRAFEG